MTKREQELADVSAATGWYAYRDADCTDRYLVGLAPLNEKALAETLEDIARPGGTIYGWEAIGTMVYVTEWMRQNPYTEIYNTNGSRRDRNIIEPVYNSAYWFKNITVIDPETDGEVEVALYRHDNGGIFGMDTAFLVDNNGDFETLDPEDDDSDAILLDPFQPAHDHPNDVKVRLLEVGPKDEE